MSAKKTDILQIRKYLDGELDAAAMHKLEREAQDDPFLMDALEGYEAAAPDQQPNLAGLDQQLQQRIAEQKVRKVIPWRYYAAAASLLLFLIVGYEVWQGKQQQNQQKLTASNLPAAADHVVVNPDTAISRYTEKRRMVASNLSAPEHMSVRPELKPAASPSQNVAANNPGTTAPTAYKADTMEYKANDYKVNQNAKIDNLLKKMEGYEVGADGSVKSRGSQALTQITLNGKDYAGGDVRQAIKNLPADVVEKAQVIDDYGDQAARAGIKSKKDSLALKEVTVAGYNTLTKKDITTGNTPVTQTLLGKINGADVTTPPRISGTVYNELGLALPGVSVLIDGTRNSTFTDDKGRFSLPANGQATLNLRYIGFESAQVRADANDSLQIKLKPSSASLSEVVITRPYQKTEKVVNVAYPRIGWDEYNKYLKTMAISNAAGTVNLSFTVNAQGALSNFQIISGPGDVINQQAINLVKNGPAWYGDTGGESKTVKLKIQFSKK